jgi:hypothetical protein
MEISCVCGNFVRWRSSNSQVSLTYLVFDLYEQHYTQARLKKILNKDARKHHGREYMIHKKNLRIPVQWMQMDLVSTGIANRTGGPNPIH